MVDNGASQFKLSPPLMPFRDLQSIYSHIISRLWLAGYPVWARDLPTSGGSLKTTVSDDVTFLRTHLTDLCDKGRDIILVLCHTAGITGGMAMHNLDKTARGSQGKAGGVIGIVLAAAVVALENETGLVSSRRLWTMKDNYSEVIGPSLQKVCLRGRGAGAC